VTHVKKEQNKSSQTHAMTRSDKEEAERAWHVGSCRGWNMACNTTCITCRSMSGASLVRLFHVHHVKGGAHVKGGRASQLGHWDRSHACKQAGGNGVRK
jgi:hypothetical protein